jgi:hypothetical protein
MHLRGDTLLDALGAKARQHGHHVECQRRVQEWVTGENGHADLISLEKTNAWRFDALASAMYADREPDTVVAAACLTIWIAVLDDIVEERPDRIPELRAAHISGDARTGTTSASLVRAWRDVRGRLSARADRDFERRIDAALQRLFDAYVWEAGVRESRRLPALTELEAHRHASGGLPLYLLLLERSVGGPFPPQVQEAGWFLELNRLAGNLTCFANDILSAQWDRDIENPINLTRVLSGDSPERHDRALAYFLDEFARLRTLIAGARAHAAPGTALGAYLDALPTLVTGVAVWMQETRRYETPGRDDEP